LFPAAKKFRPYRVIPGWRRHPRGLIFLRRGQVQPVVFAIGDQFRPSGALIHIPNSNAVRLQLSTNRPQNMLEEFLRLGFPGERRERLGKRFQLAAREVLRDAHGFDVRVCAVPLHHLSLLVVKGHSLEQKPAILAIKPPQPRLVFAGFTRRED